jgi:hypothetical protein
MSILTTIGGLLSVLALIYLGIALLYPEKLS